MRYEIIPRLTTILLHHSAGGVRPASGLEVMQLGNLGVIYSLRGAGFYEALANGGLAIFREAGIDTVLAAVSKVHLRTMRQALKDRVTVRRLGSVGMHGHSFELVVIREVGAATPSPFEEVSAGA